MPNQPPPDSVVARRGRSRQVSDSALARQASEERHIHRKLFIIDSESNSARPMSPPLPIVSPMPMRAAYAPPFMRSASPSPPSSASMSPDYYDSPPSPPLSLSLEDQVHAAWAVDDIHLAKILLLRLKGIEVTSDDDPRIAAVQDEDFDFCFVPHGALLDERDEKRMQELQAEEMARLEERRRIERLRACERKWEEEKRRLREERVAVLRRKEKKKLEEEHETRRAAEEERRRAKRNSSRKIVTFKQPSPSPFVSQSQTRSQFVYDFPFAPSPSSSCPSTPPRTPPLVPSKPIQPQPVFDESLSVSFNDVFKSMQGALFPHDFDLRKRRTPSPARTRTRSQRRQERLLDALLVEMEYSEEERRKRKGKQRALPRRALFAPCLACNSAAPSPPPLSPALSTSSSSSIPRTSSWLSFRNSSASSSTTDLTTPSSSPIASSKSNWFISPRPKSWLADHPSSLRHSCRPHSLTPVSPADSPLPIDLPHPPKPAPISHLGRQRSTSTVRAAKEGAGTLVRRMSKFVELAKGFQNAYVTTALFSVAASYDNFEDRDLDVPGKGKNTTHSHSGDPSSSSHIPSRSTPRPKLRPAGYRVSSLDVAIFLDPTPLMLNSSQIANDIAKSAATPRYIPLTSPFPLTGSPHTVLPDPLPYCLYFKPVPSPTRSPFRFNALSELHTMYPSSDPAPSANRVPGQVSWRIRSVGNPVHLRLKALHNIMWKRGVQWEGIARETALGGGRERVVGVAYEGIGRSLLTRAASSLPVSLAPPPPPPSSAT